MEKHVQQVQVLANIMKCKSLCQPIAPIRRRDTAIRTLVIGAGELDMPPSASLENDDRVPASGRSLQLT